jgi:Fe-S-cluster containining protein
MLDVSGKNPFYANGLRFSCKRCSACCRHEAGFVFLTEKDLSSLESALSMGTEEFLEIYCRWIPGENGKNLALKEKPNYDCIFWEMDGCSVYEARPLQCRSFPFWHSVLADENAWKMTACECPGMNSGVLHSHESIKNWLASRKSEPIISRSVY